MAPSKDSVLAILNSYYSKRVSADAAAKVLVDYQIGGGAPINVQMDPALQAAVAREAGKRQRP